MSCILSLNHKTCKELTLLHPHTHTHALKDLHTPLFEQMKPGALAHTRSCTKVRCLFPVEKKKEKKGGVGEKKGQITHERMWGEVVGGVLAVGGSAGRLF